MAGNDRKELQLHNDRGMTKTEKIKKKIAAMPVIVCYRSSLQ